MDLQDDAGQDWQQWYEQVQRELEINEQMALRVGTIFVREDRGSFAESMDTAARILCSVEALTDHVNLSLKKLGLSVEQKDINVDEFSGYDCRNGWVTYIVTINGYGVWGYADISHSHSRKVFSACATALDSGKSIGDSQWH